MISCIRIVVSYVILYDMIALDIVTKYNEFILDLECVQVSMSI
jgi:hypothetical protein